ncbi:hypothetical protein [Kitasatospora kazusensis]|uniref:hypothetical protein n=1 Tax=Kitasatospora kazusensis TaxID=407974 RepID=UPI0031CFBB43
MDPLVFAVTAGRRRRAVAGSLAAGPAFALVTALFTDRLPAALAAGLLGAALVAGCCLGHRTTLTQQGIRTRRLLLTRVHPWAAVRDIVVEEKAYGTRRLRVRVAGGASFTLPAVLTGPRAYDPDFDAKVVAVLDHWRLHTKRPEAKRRRGHLPKPRAYRNAAGDVFDRRWAVKAGVPRFLTVRLGGFWQLLFAGFAILTVVGGSRSLPADRADLAGFLHSPPCTSTGYARPCRVTTQVTVDSVVRSVHRKNDDHHTTLNLDLGAATPYRMELQDDAPELEHLPPLTRVQAGWVTGLPGMTVSYRGADYQDVDNPDQALDTDVRETLAGGAAAVLFCCWAPVGFRRRRHPEAGPHLWLLPLAAAVPLAAALPESGGPPLTGLPVADLLTLAGATATAALAVGVLTHRSDPHPGKA